MSSVLRVERPSHWGPDVLSRLLQPCRSCQKGELRSVPREKRGGLGLLLPFPETPAQ